MTARIPLYPILIVNFIGALGFSLVLPFLVFLVTKFGGNAQIYGVLGATYPVFQLIGAPILGKWSDIYGRRKVLLLSQAGTLMSWIIFLVALNLPMHTVSSVDTSMLGKFVVTLPLLVLFFARALDGLTGGNISVANAYVADISSEEERSQNFGKMSISSNLGFIVGPVLAGILGATVLKESLPVLAAILISLAATLIIACYLPESKPCIMSKQPDQAPVRKVFGQEHKDCFDLEGADKIRLKDTLKLRHIPYILMLYFLIFLGFTVFYTAFPVHVVQSLEWSIFELGLFFSFLGGMMIAVQGPLLSRLSRVCSHGFLILVGSLILATNFILMTSANVKIIYVAALLFAVGNGLMWPSVLSLLSKLAGEKYQGSVQGLAGSVGSLASIFGLILGGVLYGVLHATTFLVCAAIIYLIFLFSFRLLSFEKGSPI